MADEEGHCEIRQIGCSAYYAVAIDRFQRDKRDPSVIVFNEIKRCQLPYSTQFSKSKKGAAHSLSVAQVHCLDSESTRTNSQTEKIGTPPEQGAREIAGRVPARFAR